jgi:hypothetical protein
MKALWLALGVVALGMAVFALTDAGQMIIGMERAELFGPQPPAIYATANLGKVTDWRNSGKVFNTAIQKTYPPGTPTRRLISELSAQGFIRTTSTATKCRVYPSQNNSQPYCPDWDTNWNPHNELTYTWFRIPCDHHMRVRWSSDAAGRIAHIEGYYGTACL